MSSASEERPLWVRLLAPSDHSGVRVARLFYRLLAVVFAIAWLSLGAQITVLVGERGLLPARQLLAALESEGLGFAEAPTVFWCTASDTALKAGIAVGLVLSCAALAGVCTRLCFALMTALYLSYAVVCHTFLSFQWDNLLLECGALAAVLPARPSRPQAGLWIHALFRVLCFKLYFESGVAKWQSPIGDWLDGSAMTFYYETAPLPTPLSWFAHALPDGWHHVESWTTLLLELVVPFAFFGPRRARLTAAAALTGFQLINAATANYGFFCWLSVALHVFLLDEADVARAAARIRRTKRFGHAWRAASVTAAAARRRWLRPLCALLRWRAAAPPPWRARASRVVTGLVAAAYLIVSATLALERFQGGSFGVDDLGPLRVLATPLRLVNNYHLFSQITRDRIEPEIQTSDADDDPVDPSDPDAGWTAQHLHYKPGDVRRAPKLVAPHQPRLDFQLWFYGLSMRRGAPPYVTTLLDRVCNDPAAVASLFAAPLPAHPARARIAFWRYRFSSTEQRHATGVWWTRERMVATRPLPCRHHAAAE